MDAIGKLAEGFWRGRPGVVRALTRSSVVLLAVLLIACASFVAAQTVSRYVRPPAYWRERIHEMLRVPVVDAQGALVGFLPPPSVANLEKAFAVLPDVIPEACIELVIQQEDRYHGDSLRHWNGVDIGGIARGLGGVGGGSTVEMQLARILAPDWSRGNKYLRKAKEVAAAGTLLAVHDGDARKLAWSYLALAPFGRGYGDLRGIGAAADVFFHTPVAQLTPAQCAVLIAQLPRPLPLERREDPQVLRLWQASLRRAATGLATAANGAYRDAIVDLDAWSAAIPLRPEIPGASESARVNLGVRTRQFVLQHEGRIRSETTAEGSASASRLQKQDEPKP